MKAIFDRTKYHGFFVIEKTSFCKRSKIESNFRIKWFWEQRKRIRGTSDGHTGSSNWIVLNVAFHTKIKIIMNNDFPKISICRYQSLEKITFHTVMNRKMEFASEWEKLHATKQKWIFYKETWQYFKSSNKHLSKMIHSKLGFFFLFFPILIRRVPTQSEGK